MTVMLCLVTNRTVKWTHLSDLLEEDAGNRRWAGVERLRVASARDEGLLPQAIVDGVDDEDAYLF